MSYDKDSKPIVLSAEAERHNLAVHGTKPFPPITARNILQAAERDVKYAAINRERRRANANLEFHQRKLKEPMLPYSFPRSIADKAKSAREILAAVIEQQPAAIKAAEMMLWGDMDKVREALALARAA